MTRGGKREGAGRPPVDPSERRVARSLSMPRRQWDALDKLRDDLGARGRGEVVEWMIELAEKAIAMDATPEPPTL